MSHDRDNDKNNRPSVSVEGKKLLSIYYRHKPGGLCKRMYMMFDAWVARGGEVHTVSAEPFPVSHPRIIQHILWTPFQNKEGFLFWLYFLCMTPFYALLIACRSQIDIVSVFSGIYGFLSFFVRFVRRTPLLVLVRADVLENNRLKGCFGLRIWLEELLATVGFRTADRVVTVSMSLKDIMCSRYGVNIANVFFLSNNIPKMDQKLRPRSLCREKLGLDPEVFVIVTVAVLDARKNIALLIRASTLLKKKMCGLCCGGGARKAKLGTIGG